MHSRIDGQERILPDDFGECHVPLPLHFTSKLLFAKIVLFCKPNSNLTAMLALSVLKIILLSFLC